MHGRERAHHERDNNRLVRPFEWGLSFISDHVNGDDPREVLRRPTRQRDETQSYPVQFKGSVKGKNMKLTVTRTDTRDLIGTFTLIHGQEPELVKCR
jgi:hypothetical protein